MTLVVTTTSTPWPPLGAEVTREDTTFYMETPLFCITT